MRLRLLGGKAVLIRGEEAARFFYTEPTMRRGPAVPWPIARSLFGDGAVHGLDEGHQRRKDLFTSILDDAAPQDVQALVTERWDASAPRWNGEVDLFEQVARMLFEAGCAWVGLSLSDRDVHAKTRDMLAMIDGFGSAGPRHFRAHRARSRVESWVRREVLQARADAASASPTIVERIARHTEEDGTRLPSRVAAVEVINLVRPLVAVAWLVSMAAVALDRWPEFRTDVREGTLSPLEVAQEVRRYYPFVPVLAARPAHDVVWRDQQVEAGTLVVLDVWGTNHDSRLWRHPDRFDPRRFHEEPVSPYNLIPQGGGSREVGHRCPGEDVTLMVMTALIERLAERPLRMTTGHQVGLRRMPPKPSFAAVAAPRLPVDSRPGG